jgi:hypothetical protein
MGLIEMLKYIVVGLLVSSAAMAQPAQAPRAPVEQSSPPVITLTPAEVQQIMNALAPPEMKMLIGKLQQAEREAQHKEPETPKP